MCTVTTFINEGMVPVNLIYVKNLTDNPECSDAQQQSEQKSFQCKMEQTCLFKCKEGSSSFCH